MKHILAAGRLVFILTVIFLGALVVFLFGWLPVYKKRMHFTIWITSYLCRIVLWVARVQVDFPPREEVMAHEGLFFANHCTYFDILAMSYMMPLRYLAKAEVAKWPAIGYLARRVGCVFVERRRKSSRTAARQQVTEIEHYPPLVLYPEGRRNNGYELLPFRYGAFEIAVQGRIPYTPLVILYDRQDIFASPRGENVILAAWRVLSHIGRLKVKILFMETVLPDVDADPAVLAEETRAAMLEILSTRGPYKKEGETAAVTQATPSSVPTLGDRRSTKSL